MNAEQLKADWNEMVENGVPTEYFWECWSDYKTELKALGVVVTKTDDGYRVALGEPPAPKKPSKLLALQNIPTVREFAQCDTREKRAAILEKIGPATAKTLGLIVTEVKPAMQTIYFAVKGELKSIEFPIGEQAPEIPALVPAETAWDYAAEYHGKISVIPASGGGFVMTGISAFSLHKGSFGQSNRTAKNCEGLIRSLSPRLLTLDDKKEDREKRLADQILDMPLNEAKAFLQGKAAAGMARYFSPEERTKRADREAHNYAMQNDRGYAFEYERSIARGEEIKHFYPGAPQRDVEAAAKNDEAISANE